MRLNPDWMRNTKIEKICLEETVCAFAMPAIAELNKDTFAAPPDPFCLVLAL